VGSTALFASGLLSTIRNGKLTAMNTQANVKEANAAHAAVRKRANWR
jgi:rhamnogalacturonyl hydrolase YesR